ncbi:MAG TPA: xanthine dehydrogenase family protein molybdopterin-binding subunit [Usitatibacter sp.]|nr:xanthine dehydrogenase family protein molybdopterin-binding subunit [Usitatibacter sp.]
MPAPGARTQSYPAGIAGVALGRVEREVPGDEAPALAPNAELAVVGKPVPRADARAKVTGAARYTVDVRLPGLLHARLLRSPHPHARVVAIDLSAAARHPNVRAVQEVARASGLPVEEGQAAKQRRVLYAGEAVAAVAAVTPEDARAALDLVKVDYEPLPFVVDIDEALAPGAPLVYAGPVHGGNYFEGAVTAAGLPQHGNLRGPTTVGTRGDAERALAAAEVVVEGEYRTQVQTHCCVETHAVVADWRADGLTVYMSTQYAAGVRNEVAAAFGLPRSRVRVIVEAMGGGFGSKSSAGNYVLAAVALSRSARAPVRLVLDREEEHLDSGNRPATIQRLRLGATRDGRLAAIAVEERGTAGVGLGAGVGNIAQALYECANVSLAQSDVFINAGPGSPMRAPGNVPGAFGLEQAIDELAERLALDPLALRDRIDVSAVRREERRRGAERIGWARRHRPGADAGAVKRGIGVAQSHWPANIQTNSSCEVRILRDGSVEVCSSVQDIGTGITTLLAQVVAEELGLRAQDVTVRIGDTEFPAGPPSYGSLTTASITPPARNAAYRALRELAEVVAPTLGVAAEEVVARDGRLATRDGSRGIAFREAAARLPSDRVSAIATRSEDYGGFGRRFGDMAMAREALGGVQFAAVAVDTETGIVRVERVVAVHDCGRPINPRQVESQVHGGILMGISYALYERRVFDRRTGHMLNANLEQYKIARAREVPAIDVVLLEHYQGTSATDAYGVAEPAKIPTAPAIANAIYNAIGVRVRELPITPAAVLRALGRLGAGS